MQAPQIETLRCEWVAAPRPSSKLLVVLHGRGDSSAGFRWLPSALGFDDLNFLLVNAPDRYYEGYSWYALPPGGAPGVLRSRGLLDALFAELGRHGARPQDTALLGFSQGCLMTLEWGGRTELELAAYVGISGCCLDPDALLGELSPPARRPVWLITHGQQDEVLPYEVTRTQIDRLVAGGWDLDFRSYQKSHTVDPYDELPTIRAFLGGKLSLGAEGSS